MVFQKKIIIGSLVSFVATVLGIIAVFFPDLLNLQKEKIQKYSADISNEEEAEKFINFLDKMAEEKKIFELDVMLCFENPDNAASYYYKMDDFLVAVDSYEVDYTDKNTIHIQQMYPYNSNEDQFSSLEEYEELCFKNSIYRYNTEFCGGADYYFDIKGQEEVASWIFNWAAFARDNWEVNHGCYPDAVGLYLTGHYLLSKRSSYKISVQNTFKLISPEQLRLKDY